MKTLSKKKSILSLALLSSILVGVAFATITSNNQTHTDKKVVLSISDPINSATINTAQWSNSTISYASKASNFPLSLQLVFSVVNATSGATTISAPPLYVNNVPVSGSVSGTTATYTSATLTIASSAVTTAYGINYASANDGTSYSVTVKATTTS